MFAMVVAVSTLLHPTSSSALGRTATQTSFDDLGLPLHEVRVLLRRAGGRES